MPRSPIVASPPPGTTPQIPNTVIQSSVWNAAIDDIYQVLNTAQPVAYGGTGATDAAGARTNLGVLPSDVNPENILINSLGTINQRTYVNGAAAPTNDYYCIDRWKIVGAGQSVAWSASEGALSFTCPPNGIQQIIEGASITGGVYSISWVGTATALVNGVAAPNGSSFTLTGGSNASVTFSNGTLRFPMVNKGSAPAPFSIRPVQQELALCQRYYCVTQGSARFTATAGGQIAETYVYWPVTMRIAPPTLPIVGTAVASANSSTVVSNPTTTGIRFVMTSAAAGDSYAVGVNIRAEAEL